MLEPSIQDEVNRLRLLVQEQLSRNTPIVSADSLFGDPLLVAMMAEDARQAAVGSVGAGAAVHVQHAASEPIDDLRPPSFAVY